MNNFIIVSGGPGPFDNRDVEHDQSWANYVTPPLLLAQKGNFSESNEEVWWFVFKPAYERRWTEDSANPKKQGEIARVKRLIINGQAVTSYVDLIEKRAKNNKWKLSWLNNETDFWSKLGTFNNPISRLWYWGHARNDLWLSLTHSSSGGAQSPSSDKIIEQSNIASNSSLKSKFIPGGSSLNKKQLHRFIGCNTESFAKEWAKIMGVWAEGIGGFVNFCSLHKTGGDPCLAGATSSLAWQKIFRPGGHLSSLHTPFVFKSCGTICKPNTTTISTPVLTEVLEEEKPLYANPIEAYKRIIHPDLQIGKAPINLSNTNAHLKYKEHIEEEVPASEYRETWEKGFATEDIYEATDVDLSTILPAIRGKWNTYIYVVGTDDSGGSDYNVMRRRLIDVIRETVPYLIMTFDFKSAEATGNDIEFRIYYNAGSNRSGSRKFPLNHSLNQLFRTIENNSALLSIRHLHFLTHFQNDMIYYSVHKDGFTINDLKASIRNNSKFKRAIDEDAIIKIHGCQMDLSILRKIGKYCKSSSSTEKESILNSVKARIRDSFVYKFSEFLNLPIWAGPIGTYSSYHCKYLSAIDDGKRFCIEKDRFKRTLSFYESVYSQFFSRESKESVFDFTYHLKYKSRIKTTFTGTPACSQSPSRSRDYGSGNSRIISESIISNQGKESMFKGERATAGSKSNQARISIRSKESNYVAKGENPRGRIYIVTTGPNNKNTDPVRLKISVENRNDTYNMKDTFFLASFLAQDDTGVERVVPFKNQKPDEKYKKISGGNQIPDESTKSFEFVFSLDLLRRAYKVGFRGEKKTSFKSVLELQFYWQEYFLGGADRYWNLNRIALYIVNPIEFFNYRKINVNQLQNPDPFGDKYVKKILVNASNRDILVEIKVSRGILNSSRKQIESKISVASQQEVSISNETEVSVGIEIEEIIKAGGKSTNTVGYKDLLRREISKAYLRSQTLTKSFSQSVTTKLNISAPSGKARKNTYYVKPVFEPYLVDIADYSDVNQYGFARERKVYKNQVIWKFSGFLFDNFET